MSSATARAEEPARPSGFDSKRTVKLDASAEDFLPVEAPSGDIAKLLTFVSPGPIFANYLFTGDLAELKKRGILRVLVHGAGDLWAPPPGTPEAGEQVLVEELAEQLGLRVEWVLVETRAQLVDALVGGRGDLVAAGLTPVDDARITLAQPLRRAPWVVAGPRGGGLAPSLAALAGRTLLVRPGSAAARALGAAAKKEKVALKLVAVPDALSDDELLRRVAKQSAGLALVPRALAEARAEALSIETTYALPVAVAERWAVRKDATKLRAALDSALTERALRDLPDARYSGDLDGVRARGVLRLLTRNNGRNYFVRGGARAGLELELAEQLAKNLAVRLEVVVVPTDAQLVPWLLEGRGDVVGASFVRTERDAVRLRLSRPYAHSRGVLVRRAGARDELAGATVTVLRGAVHRARLEAERRAPADFQLRDAPEDHEPEDVLRALASSTEARALAVVPREVARAELARGLPIELWRPVGDGDDALVLAVRPTNPALATWVDRELAAIVATEAHRDRVARYFEPPLLELPSGEVTPIEVGAKNQLSPFDGLIRKYAEQYSLDWRLSAAQAFAESRFRADARSRAGAVGLFQVMPRTGKSLGFDDLTDPEQSTHAGVKYLSQQLARFDPGLPLAERLRFALASYNAGYGHVADARRLALEEGLDPDTWTGAVERALLLLENKEYARRAASGWCRGSETVKYVQKIQGTYDRYVTLVRP